MVEKEGTRRNKGLICIVSGGQSVGNAVFMVAENVQRQGEILFCFKQLVLNEEVIA